MSKQLSLEEVIFNDMKVALKENEKLKLSTLRLIRAAIKNDEISKKDKLTEDEIIGIISNHLKKLEESLDLFIKGQRPELADKAKKEIKIIKEYLPEQLSEEEVAKIVKDTIIKFEFKGLQDIGPAMREIMPPLKGKIDGKIVNNMVRDLLDNSKN
ncbi:glutamyl-tRNA amidotransferase [Candidatus Atribacteria bacterium RBG_19FT_COMBO_35_14]|uniref:Glutamyl-tRNA amidotransferase n=1 Tax=Candidatus Sediminicultor quintus TaxID=1797291 RepID=A0A1F5AA11_9BACT|nr:MAG: glutamyl-tRNA amidotransferase [Candidatus Atribacteria bacterium RBG_19FT_COMBO_35_14]